MLRALPINFSWGEPNRALFLVMYKKMRVLHKKRKKGRKKGKPHKTGYVDMTMQHSWAQSISRSNGETMDQIDDGKEESHSIRSET